MSLSVINRGATGGLRPELIVTAPEGSTLTLRTEGLEKAIYQLGETETQHTFPVTTGTWTVTATLGTSLASTEVTVDRTGQFYAALSFAPHYLMLYDFGDECEDVTGGWSDVTAKTSGSASGVYNWAFRFSTVNPLDISLYSRLGVIGTVSGSDSSYVGWVNLAADRALPMDGAAVKIPQGTTAKMLQVSDIPENAAESVYVSEGVSWTSSNTFGASFSKGTNYLHIASANKNGDKDTVVNLSILALFAPDNWQSICTLAGLTPPETMEELLSDSASLAALLASQAAVETMVQICTGDFMASAIASSTFLTALSGSAYESAVRGNEHWAKFLGYVE